jgi:hypothetical protein
MADSKALEINYAGATVGNSDWLNLIDKLGLPVVALVAIGYALYNSCKWIGTNILLPIHNRHLIFLERLELGIEKIVDVQHNQNSQLINLTQKISDSLETKEPK